MKNELRLAGVIRESIVDGPGYRFVIFTQGCLHHCPGCQNPDTHPIDGGYLSSVDKLINEIKKDKLLKGVTLSGGDPFLQAKPLTELSKIVNSMGLDVVAFSGWTFEELLNGADNDNGWLELLCELSLLIDGKYIESQRSLELRFRGSENQRIINVKESLKTGKAVLSELN